MKKIILSLIMVVAAMTATATDFYVSPTGSDAADGSEKAPFATLRKAIEQARPGTTIYLREGTLQPKPEEMMGIREGDVYACMYILQRSGTAEQPITICGYPGERAVIDLSLFKPEGKRVSGFMVRGDYWRLKNFEMTGCQVTIVGHTQSENISLAGGSHCIVEGMKLHDGMGIGVYMMRGKNNLILNCDAYNNYDSVSGNVNGDGGNCDGFGIHLRRAEYTGNVIRGCRAWRNSDDGYDLINNYAAVTIEDCWAMENGFDANMTSRGDGNGIKAGGFNMGRLKAPIEAPQNIIRNCIAYRNKQSGIYANHHLGGNLWENNTAYRNKRNFNLVNRQSWEVAKDIPGYDHIVRNNLAYKGSSADAFNIDADRCTLENNSFMPDLEMTNADFLSLDAEQLKAPRKADGSLPDITFMQPKPGTKASERKLGYRNKGI